MNIPSGCLFWYIFLIHRICQPWVTHCLVPKPNIGIWIWQSGFCWLLPIQAPFFVEVLTLFRGKQRLFPWGYRRIVYFVIICFVCANKSKNYIWQNTIGVKNWSPHVSDWTTTSAHSKTYPRNHQGKVKIHRFEHGIGVSIDKEVLYTTALCVPIKSE